LRENGALPRRDFRLRDQLLKRGRGGAGRSCSSSHADILGAVTAQRTSLRLRVAPGTNRPGIVGRYGDGWKVRVSAPAEAGRANEAVLALLAHTLDVPLRDLQLASGRSSRDKIVTLVGMATETAEARLAAAAKGAE